MRRMIFLTGTLLISLVCIPAFSAVTLNYYNNDPQDLTVKVIIDGLPKMVTFKKQGAGFLMIPGAASKAEIVTPQGRIEINDGDRVQIAGGMIQKQ